MRYKISDISRLLNISSNTVRRYEDMGYINPIRDDKSRYRYYSDEDINKIINIRMLRKYGFSHIQISQMINKNMEEQIYSWEERLSEIKNEIDYLNHLYRRLKGNVNIAKRVSETVFEIRDCVDMQYVLYQKNGKLLNEERELEVVQEFMYSAPEVQPIIVFDKDKMFNEDISFSEGWAIKTKDMDKFQIKEDSSIIAYPKRTCVFATLKLFVDKEKHKNKDLVKNIKEDFSKINRFIKENNLKVVDNPLGINAASAEEGGNYMQYILLSIPVEKDL